MCVTKHLWADSFKPKGKKREDLFFAFLIIAQSAPNRYPKALVVEPPPPHNYNPTNKKKPYVPISQEMLGVSSYI